MGKRSIRCSQGTVPFGSFPLPECLPRLRSELADSGTVWKMNEPSPIQPHSPHTESPEVAHLAAFLFFVSCDNLTPSRQAALSARVNWEMITRSKQPVRTSGAQKAVVSQLSLPLVALALIANSELIQNRRITNTPLDFRPSCGSWT